MDNVIEKRRSRLHLIHALISVACPFIAFGLVYLYQGYAYEWYWKIGAQGGPLDDADINAGAMMGIVIVVQLIMAVGIGSLVGLLFAGMSLRRRRRILSVGTAALLFNLLPFIATAAFFVRGYMRGF